MRGVIVLLSHLSVFLSFGQEHLNKQIDEIVSLHYNHRTFTGVVLVAKDGNPIYQSGFGKASIEWDKDNLPETRFVLGSISKSFTATLTMKLVQEEKLELDETIDYYIKDFPKDKARRITVFNLLSNTSGIPNYFMLPGWTEGAWNREVNKKMFVQELGKLELQFPSGSDYLYSNSGYYLLGLIIEKATGLDYESALHKYLLEPLNMRNTGIAANHSVVLQKATGYRFDKGGGYRVQDYINMDLFTAAGNAYSTVGDLLKLDQALYDENYLNQAHKAKLFDPLFQNGWTVDSLQISASKTLHTVSYNGQIKGYSSMLTRFVDEGYTIIILSNTGTGYNAKMKLTQDIASILEGEASRNNKLPLSLLFTKSVYEHNLEQTIQSLSLTDLPFSTDKRLLKELGQQLEWSGLEGQSKMILDFTKQLFPE